MDAPIWGKINFMSSKFKLAIIDLRMGNIRSIENSLNYLGFKYEIIKQPKKLEKYTHLILPGVGSYKKAMQMLNKTKFTNRIKFLVGKKKIKILGICLGMQLLGSSSNEGGYTKGLSLIKNKVLKFNTKELKTKKIPHVGFNSIEIKSNKNNFFKNIPEHANFYFVHSYRMLVENFSNDFAITKYGISFLACFNKENIYGAQFHPEKSQNNGLNLIKNFLK